MSTVDPTVAVVTTVYLCGVVVLIGVLLRMAYVDRVNARRRGGRTSGADEP